MDKREDKDSQGSSSETDTESSLYWRPLVEWTRNLWQMRN